MPRRYTLRGVPVKLTFATPHAKRMRGVYGYAQRHGHGGWSVHVAGQLRGVDRLDTLIHEFLHVAMPDLHEDTVRETATGVASILWDIGYRGVGDDQRGAEA